MVHMDWNLLRLMAVLYRTENVSRAAEELGLSQSAVSHALGRLRAQFGDPLFVRTSRGVVATEVALALRAEVEDVVRRAGALSERRRGGFDPATVEGRVTIATTDYFEITVLARLIPLLAVEAPGVQLSIRPAGTSLPKEDLERRRVDLAIAGFYAAVPEGFYQSKVLEDTFRTAIPRAIHRPAGPPDEDEFMAARHALVTIEGDFADRIATKGRARMFRYGTTSFSSLAWILADGGLWLTAPGLLLERYSEHFPLVVHPCPLPTPPIVVRMIWHERSNDDPLQAWFRERLKRVIKASA
jgi:DNA-binding transcriptional LysR family regulator